MSIDRVKPLKIETTIDGSVNDPFPREMDPSSDYVATKGISFEDTTTHLYEKIGSVLLEKFPTISNAPTFLGNGELDSIQYFNTTTQITANRIAKVQSAYDGSLNLTGETWTIYDTNGTSILRTITYTYTYSGVDLTSTSVVTT